MESMSLNGVVQAEYEYNALGQQVLRRLTQAGQVIHSVHDADGNRIAEYDYDEVSQSATLGYTSKTCSDCGFIFKELKSEKEWTCSECGVIHDRDENAAVNIVNKASEYFAASKKMRE